MKTICVGWNVRHAPITLKDDGATGGHVSHGMCPECARAFNEQLDYEAYLRGDRPDPRD